VNSSFILEKIRQHRAESDCFNLTIRQEIADLTKQKYEPLFDFFLECLDDPNPGWCEKALAKIHYFKNRISEPILDKIRSIALTDIDNNVRTRACGALGNVSTWPEESLTQVIEREENPFVLGAATTSIPLLRGVLPYVALELFNTISSGQIKPDLEYIENVVQKNVQKVIGLNDAFFAG
jgi:hypothetical protein